MMPQTPHPLRLVLLAAGLCVSLGAYASPGFTGRGLGVSCGSGIGGRPGHVTMRVDGHHRAETVLQIATESARPGEEGTTELEIRAAGRSATCWATDPSPFAVLATGLSFRTAQLMLRSGDSLVVEVRDPSDRLLASARLAPTEGDAVSLTW
jgi:hypothetical protein